MIEALRTLATVTDYTDEQLDDFVSHFGLEWQLYSLSIPVVAIQRARKECARVKDPGDSAVSAATIVACAEAFVDVIDTPSLQGVSDIPQAREKFLALQRAIDNMRGYK